MGAVPSAGRARLGIPRGRRRTLGRCLFGRIDPWYPAPLAGLPTAGVLLMVERRIDDPRGILNPEAHRQKVTHDRYLPTHDLSPFIEHYWVVEWSLPPGECYRSQNLPYPSVHVAVEPGGSFVYGPYTGRFVYNVAGRGEVFGIKFRPGAFRPLTVRPLSTLADRRVSPGRIFGSEGEGLTRAIRGASDVEERVRLSEDFFRARLPAGDARVELVNRIIDHVASHPEISRVAQLAARFGMSSRALQSLFHQYVGVTPKWTIRRYRIHEALAELHACGRVDQTGLALRLGYSDQAHFIKDFRAMTGVTPGRYNRENREATSTGALPASSLASAPQTW